MTSSLSVFTPGGLDAAALVARLESRKSLGQTTVGREDLAIRSPKSFPDKWRVAIGFAVEGDRDPNGSLNSSRILAKFHGRYDDLQSRYEHVLAPLNLPGIQPNRAIEFMATLIDSPVPVITYRCALLMRDVIIASFKSRPAEVAQALKDLMMRVDRAHASARASQAVLMAQARLETESEFAFLSLDLYRKQVEGQVRPWGWTVSRLLGSDWARLPELGALESHFVKLDHALGNTINSCILRVARNAAAHEDYTWDGRSRRVIIGNESVSSDELLDQTTRALAITMGLDLGLALATASDVRLERDTQVSLNERQSAIVNSSEASAFFGTNGLLITKWSCEDVSLNVEIGELRYERLTPCIQASMWAAQKLPLVQQITVRAGEPAQMAFSVPRNVLDAILPLWLPAQSWFSKMPTSVFAPVLCVARQSYEDWRRARDSTVWLALNDALHAFDLLYTPRASPLFDPQRASPRERILSSARLLELSSRSLQICMRFLPSNAQGVRGNPVGLIAEAASQMRKALASGEPGQLESLEARISKQRDEYAVPAILPPLFRGTFS